MLAYGKEVSCGKAKKLLADGLLKTVKITEVYQRQPWTFVKYSVFPDYDVELELFGFSKVCYPDKWDEEYGINLAIRKSIYAFAREEINKKQLNSVKII